jgi:hypothetical protein
MTQNVFGPTFNPWRATLYIFVHTECVIGSLNELSVARQRSSKGRRRASHGEGALVSTLSDLAALDSETVTY